MLESSRERTLLVSFPQIVPGRGYFNFRFWLSRSLSEMPDENREIKVNLSVLKEITLLKSALVEMFDFYILNQYVLITFSDAPQKYTYFNVLHNILKHL